MFFCREMKIVWCPSTHMSYSTDRTQPNTKADPESGPEVRFGSASSPLFKNLRPLWSARRSLWVCSGSAPSPLCVRSWWGVRFAHSCVKRTPLCCYRLQAPPLVYSKYTVQPVHSVVAIGSICRTVKRFQGEHQQNHQNFALYSAKNCYSERTFHSQKSELKHADDWYTFFCNLKF